MKRTAALLVVMLLVPACSGQPAPKAKDIEKAPEANVAKETADAVKAEKKNIEEAAEAAVKLVEEESRQEIDALQPSDAQ